MSKISLDGPDQDARPGDDGRDISPDDGQSLDIIRGPEHDDTEGLEPAREDWLGTTDELEVDRPSPARRRPRPTRSGEEHPASRVARSPESRRLAMQVVAGVAGLVIVVGLGWWIAGFFVSDPPPPMVESRLTAPDAAVELRGLALAPDGQRLVYADGDGLRQVGSGGNAPRVLELPAGLVAQEVAWSPGPPERLVFAGRSRRGFEASLWSLPLRGGSPVRLREDAHSPAASPDGQRLAFVEGGPLGQAVWTAAPDGGDAVRLAGDRQFTYQFPAWSADGNRLAFTRISRDFTDAAIVTMPAGGGDAVAAIRDFDQRTGAVWASPTRLIFARRAGELANLWSVETDGKTGEVVEEPRQLTRWEEPAYVTHLSVDAEGRRLAFLRNRTQIDAFVARRQTDGSLDEPKRFTAGGADRTPVAWSPDGDLYSSAQGEGSSRMWLEPADGGEARDLGPGRLWARSASGTLFYGQRESNGVALMARAPGAEQARQLYRLPVGAELGPIPVRCPIRPDRHCLLAEVDGDQLVLRELDPSGRLAPGRALTQVALKERDHGWNISPKGSTVAVVNGGRILRLVTLRDGKERKITLRESVYAQSVAWHPEGRSLFVTGMILHSSGGYVLYEVRTSGQARRLWETRDRWFAEPTPFVDGSRLALAARSVDSAAWMLENF